MLTLCLLLQGGVFVVLVALELGVVEVEVTFREDTEWRFNFSFES
jgi:hypothetical protein